MDEKTLKALEEAWRKRWPMGIPRTMISEATGGVLNPRTMANQDCLGCGIEGAFKIGRQKIYPVTGVLETIQKRIVL